MNDWTKQPQQLPGRYLNAGSGMSQVGGTLSGVPASIGASQGIQDIPGDRLIVDSMAADALSDPDVATLYGGMFQFVHVAATPTATATIARLAFWDNDSADPTDGDMYDVTPDEDDFIAGVFINTLTDDYYWWIQIAGQVDAYFRSALAVATQGAGVYAARLGAGANVGAVTQFAGTYSNATNEEVDQMINRYMGQAVELPVAATAKLINISGAGFRVRW